MSVSVDSGKLPGGERGIKWIGVRITIRIEKIIERIRMMLFRRRRDFS
jgi:hypothetical protein